MLTNPQTGEKFCSGDSDKSTPQPSSSMTLNDLLVDYLAEREASIRYQESLRRTVRRATEYGIKNLCQLEPDRVNKFLANAPVGQTTRANYRRELQTLWRFAYETGAAKIPPLRIKRIKPARRPVVAWTLEQVKGLLAFALKDETPIGVRSPLRRCDLLPAWILLAYDSGLRFSDVLHVRRGDIQNGCVSVVCRKTGQVEARRLSAACIRTIQALPKSQDGTLFRWAVPRRRAFAVWRGFLDTHGIDGSSKYLRRAGATAVAAQHGPEAASAFLGHSAGNGHLAKLHYIDATLSRLPVGPPPLA